MFKFINEFVQKKFGDLAIIAGFSNPNFFLRIHLWSREKDKKSYSEYTHGP